MTIAVVAYKFGTEKELGEHLGTYHYFIEKMRRLVKMGHEVYVIAPWLTFFRKGSVDVDGVKVLRYYPPSFNHPKLLIVNSLMLTLYIRATRKQVLALDREHDLGIIYVWQARGAGYAVASIAHELRAPFVFRQITAWQWHLQRPMLDKRKQVKFARTIYEKAKRVVFVSKAASAEGSAMGLDPKKIAVLGVGIETNLFQPQYLEKKYDMLFIGRINFAEKGIGYLLKAMSEIIRAVPDAKLGIVGGGGESKEMNDLIVDLGIKDHVELLGKRRFSELPKYLNASKVFVMPSVWMEHFGQVTIEAMACGVPVVGTDIGGTPEIISDTGIVVPPRNAQALAGAIVKLLQNEALRKRLGEAARRRVEENYTYEVLINKFVKLVEDVKG